MREPRFARLSQIICRIWILNWYELAIDKFQVCGDNLVVVTLNFVVRSIEPESLEVIAERATVMDDPQKVIDDF